jgi:hypothetical protein
MTKRVLGEDGKLSKVIRLNEDHVGGRKSLTQGLDRLLADVRARYWISGGLALNGTCKLFSSLCR